MAVKDGLPSTDFSRQNREYIKAVAEGGSGGGGLPEITEADEGKFLGVVSGEAAWATAGGGIAVEFTFKKEETYNEYEIQMPAGELMTLCMSGPVIIYIQAGENKSAFTILRASYNTFQGGYTFIVLLGEDASSIISFTSSDVNEKPICRDPIN